MKAFVRNTAVFFAAVLLCSLLSSVFSTQFVIAGLQSINVDVTAAARLSMTVDDLHILKTLLAVVAACFLVGFLIAGACIRWVGGSRTAWYALAGGSALVTTLLLMGWQMQLMPIAGARTLFGLFTQGLAGASGGVLFSTLTKTLIRQSTNRGTALR